MHTTDQPKDAPSGQDQLSKLSGWNRWNRNPVYVVSGCVAFLTFVLVVAYVIQLRMLKTAHETAERAWVTVQDATIVGPLIANNVPRVKIAFHNTGRSPALTTKIRLLMTVWTSNKIPEGQMPPILTTDAETVGTIDPGSVTSQAFFLKTPLSEEQGVHLERKDWFTVTLGVVSYVDIFGHPHETKLCLIWRDTTTERLSPCENWNDAD